jgi:hypothetical protein
MAGLLALLRETPNDRRARKAAEAAGPATPPPAADEGAATSTGFTAERHRTTAAKFGRFLLFAVLALCLISGAWQLFGSPIARALAGPAPAPPAPVAGIDHGAASRLAVAFTADYLTWTDQDKPDTDSITQWTGERQGPSAWTGKGTLYADLVTAGQIVEDGPDRALVQTTARVSGAGQDRLVWFTLAVVVERTDGGLRVTGAAFDGDTPVALHADDNEIDTRLSNDTTDTAEQLLTAIASGDTAYVTTPHVQLAGLRGAVQLVDLSNWTVVRSGGDTRYGTATVTWRLPNSQLQVQQSLVLRITLVDGRWLLDSYGPALEG